MKFLFRRKRRSKNKPTATKFKVWCGVAPNDNNNKVDTNRQEAAFSRYQEAPEVPVESPEAAAAETVPQEKKDGDENKETTTLWDEEGVPVEAKPKEEKKEVAETVEVKDEEKEAVETVEVKEVDGIEAPKEKKEEVGTHAVPKEDKKEE
ncbi:cilia- and flagella-associated protein 251-like [Salvia splendens]|uniref:cilia- and flagella-associated protein 251-like n=1 Tax=Salvia splendens TaxID=180675 RepID=UPI001C25E32A|nr:cilia- and flagella-associated protein 251-like [Salvia splendens]